MLINTAYNNNIKFTSSAFSEFENKKDKADKVVAGSAASGTVLYQARKTLDSMSQAANNINRNATQVNSIFGKFKLNSFRIAKDIEGRIGRLKGIKFLEPVLKSSAVKGVAGAFGTGIAFFVLAEELIDAVNTGRIAINRAGN